MSAIELACYVALAYLFGGATVWWLLRRRLTDARRVLLSSQDALARSVIRTASQRVRL